MDTLRKPFFLAALVAIFLAVLLELGSVSLVTSSVAPQAASLDVSTVGKAIPAMALLDALILFATSVFGIALLIPERVQSKVQGIATAVFSLLLILAAVAIILKVLVQLVLMVSLLMAPIFGTIIYFIIWAKFGVSSAQAALGLVMLLKVMFAVCLVLAQQRFLENKGLVLIIATSFLANFIIALLYSVAPGFLTSITDAIAAIIVAVLAIVWAAVYLVGGVVSMVKAVA